MSIKVAIRVRPFNQKEIELGAKLCVSMDDNCTILHHEKQGKREFYFDYCFWSHDVHFKNKGFIINESGMAIPLNDKYSD